MSEVLDRYERVAGAFGTRMSSVAPGQWDEPTPCPGWSVRQLVVHVIDTHGRVLANVTGAEPVAADGDLSAPWAEATAGVRRALSDPAVAGTEVSGMFATQSFESLVSRLLCTDTLVHTWDLARATGQDESLDPDAVQTAHAFLAPLDEAIRRPGGFGPKLVPEQGVDDQTAFLSFCGRAG